MRLELAYITPRRQRLKSAPAQALLEDFVKRSSRYETTQAAAYESEGALLAALERSGARTRPIFVLLDSRGLPLTSEQFASRVGGYRDSGAQSVIFAIGPPDGWSKSAFVRADLRFSLGAITLPHELALAVLAEQVYRALTILAGHPYHGGHE